MSLEQRALPLIERLSQAALDPSHWEDFVSELSEALRGAAVRLAMMLPGDPLPGQCYSVGLSPELSGSFLQQMTGGLPWTSALVSRFSEGWCAYGDLFPDVDLRRTEFHRDWMKPQGLAAVWPMGSPILNDEGFPIGGLTVFRRVNGRAFGPDDYALGELLMPFVQRAAQTRIALGGVEHQRVALAEVIDRLPTGVILLDAKRQPVVTNRRAETILALKDGFGIGPNGPFAATPRDNAALRKVLERALAPEPGQELEAGGFLALERPSGRRGFVVAVMPLLNAPGNGGADLELPIAAMPLRKLPARAPSHDAVAVLFLSDPHAGQVSANEVLEAVYSLTPAEAELVSLLSRGLSLEESAELRGVTMNTARSQLKHVFAKTDTKRQGELVRLVLSGVAAIGES